MRGRDPDTGASTDSYFQIDGEPLGERNPKFINNDYVKFFRFAQWRIEKTGYGILAFITDNGYLDNLTMRGMRHSLLQSFNEIYVLNLHGSLRRKDNDQNVFDIQQGVSIGIFVKSKRSKAPAAIYYADKRGTRKDKYDWLSTNDVSTTSWVSVKPAPPRYEFIPQVGKSSQSDYRNWPAIDEIFPLTKVGPNSHRDHFAVSFSQVEASRRISDLRNSARHDEDLLDLYSLKNTNDWNIQKARQSAKGQGIDVVRCLYRPFDFRYMLYSKAIFDRPRQEINDLLRRKNVALITTKQTKDAFGALITRLPVGQHKLASRYDGSYVSPLYLYDNDRRTANISPQFSERLAAAVGLTWVENGGGDLIKTIGPEHVLNYIYGILYAPQYRSKHAVELAKGFPRIPITSSLKGLRLLCEAGHKLIVCHTSPSPLSLLALSFQSDGRANGAEQTLVRN